MGPALRTPACGFLRACPPTRRPASPRAGPSYGPPKGRRRCARRSEGRGVLEAAPRSPGSAIDGFAPRGGLIEFRGRPCGTWGGRPHPQAPAGGRAGSIGRAEL